MFAVMPTLTAVIPLTPAPELANLNQVADELRHSGPDSATRNLEPSALRQVAEQAAAQPGHDQDFVKQEASKYAYLAADAYPPQRDHATSAKRRVNPRQASRSFERNLADQRRNNAQRHAQDGVDLMA
ncbi:hypothetical protein [Magnetofaba australis]|uniref:Uncharacterized protein n=1 Tax=Magnetofaba australis IT-1 TaxID=1434232 RepID=A0A1Y2K843_9PROT|nr:hypothetical protein [Magnetofaba australis]OSM04955.1 hypothetical protein MAIT1_03072 [Magnetofaba australis IT-1]